METNLREKRNVNEKEEGGGESRMPHRKQSRLARVHKVRDNATRRVQGTIEPGRSVYSRRDDEREARETDTKMETKDCKRVIMRLAWKNFREG